MRTAQSPRAATSTVLLLLSMILWLPSTAWAVEPVDAETRLLPPTSPRRKASLPQPTRVEAGRPRPAVVRIATKEGESATSYGSGTLVALSDKHGLVLTNWHVVRDATGEISVKFPDGFRSAATVLKTDATWDLAALLIWRPRVEPVPLADEPPARGDLLTIAGFGSGDYREATGKLTQYVSPGEDEPFEMVEVDVPARSGDSGGPIFNRRGHVAGVLFGSADGCTNGSHCRRVRWFIKRALVRCPKLARSIASRGRAN